MGEKSAAALLKHFHSAPEMYRKLGLTGLPAVPKELQGEAPTSQLLKAHISTVMTAHLMEAAIDELALCLGGRTKAATMLNRLYLCGYDNVCLYRELVTLKEDMDIEEIVLRGANESDKVDRFPSHRAEIVAATADLPQTPPGSSSEVHNMVAAMQDILLDPVAATQPPQRKKMASHGTATRGRMKLTTAHFRYRGERGAHPAGLTTTAHSTQGVDGRSGTAERTSEEVEALLQGISPALTAPLQLLRQQYHKLYQD